MIKSRSLDSQDSFDGYDDDEFDDIEDDTEGISTITEPVILLDCQFIGNLS